MDKKADEVQLVGTLVTMIELAQRTREDRAAPPETAPADGDAEVATPVEPATRDLLTAALPAQGAPKPQRRFVAGAVAFVLPLIALAMAVVVVAAAATQ